ncbi:MAG TPA: GAF domain-containing protein, partial [Ramlibacter sp.]|nr:GAF domain-containing protein [Ramlibacter sp.]
MNAVPLQLQTPRAASLNTLEAALRPLGAALAREGLADAASAACTELAEGLACSRVSIGMLHGDALRLAGSSDIASVGRRAATTGVPEAMHEAIDQQRTVAWPAPPQQDGITLAQRQLAAGGSVCSVPLVDGTRIVGALTLERATGDFLPVEIAALDDVSRLVGPVLELKRQLAEPWLRRVAARWRAALAAPSRRWTLGATAFLLLVAALAVPVPWRVSAPARLEGSVQRAVVAATDGFLQQANVRPGDRVQAGQVLAELASQDMELERRRRESELRQHEGAYRAAQARSDRSQMVSHQAKAAEAQAMLSLVEGQLQRARV